MISARERESECVALFHALFIRTAMRRRSGRARRSRPTVFAVQFLLIRISASERDAPLTAWSGTLQLLGLIDE
jgi:hypothetical protein